ncbi:DUF2142 domain-containing protein [Cellulomonas hominis]|uniref:DUF2142 domain-containing protein n=1 Tax=Cellulomonas hominis TaxID=156981 RepID=UPI001443FCDA|nr:DUF2142 domain-containing protein [Cellulomonas hominis]
MQEIPGEQSSTAPRPSAAALRRTYWGAFGIIAALLVLWAVANPPMAAPDEPAHVVKAAAVVRGQLLGSSDPDNPGSGVVEVPDQYAYALAVPGCYAFNPLAPASCIPDEPADPGRTVEASTWVVRNNPLYYLVVGLPTLLPAGGASFTLMRLVSALWCAAILAWAVRSVRELRDRRFAALGLVAACTPMVLFLASSVNSSALEISSGIALWTTLLTLLRAPDPALVPRRMAAVAVLSVLLANSRGLSPFWLGLIALAVLLSSPWANTRAVLVDRRAWPWFGVIAGGFLASLLWIVHAGTLEGGGPSTGTGIGFRAAARESIAQTQAYVVSMFGHFGWLDTNLPTWTYLLLALGVGAPAVLAVLAARARRDAVAVAAVAAAAVAAPVLIQAWQAHNVGLIWQGRYSIALSVGIPLLAGFVLREGVLPESMQPRRLVVVVASLLAVGHTTAFAINLHRYTRGSAYPWFESAPTDWAPPVPALLLVVAFAAMCVLAVLALDRVTNEDDRSVVRGDSRAEVDRTEVPAP